MPLGAARVFLKSNASRLLWSGAVLLVTAVAMAQGNSERDQAIETRMRLAAAEDSGDEAELRRLLDSGFVATVGGAVVDRDSYIRAVLKERSTQTIVHDVVRIDGDTAVLVDRVTVNEPGDVRRTYRCTVTLIKRRGGWRALAGQCGVLIPEK